MNCEDPDSLGYVPQEFIQPMPNKSLLDHSSDPCENLVLFRP